MQKTDSGRSRGDPLDTSESVHGSTSNGGEAPLPTGMRCCWDILPSGRFYGAVVVALGRLALFLTLLGWYLSEPFLALREQ